MKINQFFKITIKTIFIAIICISSFVSCSSDTNTVEDNQETQLTLKSTEPVENWSVVSEIISIEGGCFKYRVSLYFTFRNSDGSTKTILTNDVIMQSGAGCDYEGEVTKHSGPYKGDWIILDQMYNGAEHIRDFWDSHPEEYTEYILVRDNIIR